MNKNNKNTKATKKRRIPVPIFLIGMIVVLLVLTFGIYFGVSFSKANVKPLLREKLGLTELPAIVEANSSKNTGKSNSQNNLTYSYSDDIDGLEIGVACTTYKKAGAANGSISYYIGFLKTNDAEITVNNAKAMVAEKWSQYASSTSSVSSTCYSTTNLNASQMKFSQTLSSTVTQAYPQKFLLGMHTVKAPNIYVYVDYTMAGKNHKVIIEFEFNDYFIEGQSTIEIA